VHFYPTGVPSVQIIRALIKNPASAHTPKHVEAAHVGEGSIIREMEGSFDLCLRPVSPTQQVCLPHRWK
jgi:hypothetical protein